MKNTIIVLFLLVLQMNVLALGKAYSEKSKQIAHQMHEIGSECKNLSSQEMKKKRLEFLNSNKEATIQDLIDAIEVEINGKNIITYLKSFGHEVCDEYALSVQNDYDRGARAIKGGYGATSIDFVMYWRLL